MAQSKIKIHYIIDDNGSLKKIVTDANKATTATDKLNKSAATFGKTQAQSYRGMQGVAGNSSNLTKNFSKQREAIGGGSSGLVGAYAILASNLFAAQAAFGALARAAQVDQLREGLDFIGYAAGQNLQRVSKGLVEITGAAVSTEQALKSTAMAISAGFSTVQLKQLTEVAKGASIALGRDMGDALDRLVRGTAKLEPEILDELGIMVKLDAAVQKYATQLNVAANSLTDFQRRQAFLNATIEEGLDKYQDIAAAVDPNPYDQLGASLNNLSKQLLSFLNNTLKLSDGVKFLANNTTAMAGVATALGTSLSRMIAPGMFSTAQAAAESSDAFLNHKKQMLGTIKVAEKLPPIYGEAIESIKAGDMTKVSAAQDSLNKSFSTNMSILRKWKKEGRESKDLFQEKSAYVEDISARLSQLNDIEKTSIESQARQASASSIQNAASLNLKAAFQDLGVQMENEKELRKEQINSTKKGTRAYGKMRIGAIRLAGSAKILGAAFATALPYIGLIVTAATILYSVIKDKFFPEDLVKNRIKEAAEAFGEFEKITSRFFKSSSEGGKALAESYIGVAGVLDQLKSQQSGVASVILTDIVSQSSKVTTELAKQKAALEDNSKKVVTTVVGAGTYGSQSVVRGENEGEFKERKALELQTVQETQAKLTKIVESEEARRKDAFLETSNSFIKNVEIQRKVSEASGRSTPFNTAAMTSYIAELTTLNTKLDKGTISTEEYQIQLGILRDNAAGIADSFKSISSAVGDFNSIMTKQTSKIKKPFEDLENGANGVLDKFKQLSAKELKLSSTRGDATQIKELKETRELLAELDKEIKNMSLPDGFEKSVAGVKKYREAIIKAQEDLAALAKTEKARQSSAKALKEVAGQLYYATDIVANAEQSALEASIARVEKEISTKTDLLNINKDDAATTKEIARLNAQLTGLQGQRVSDALIEAQHKKSMLKVAEKDLQISNLKAANAQKIKTIEASLMRGGSSEKAVQEFQLKVDQADIAINAAIAENELALSRLEIEKEILRIKFKESGDGIDADEQAVLDRLDGIIGKQKTLNAEKAKGTRLGKTGVIAEGLGAPASSTGVKVLDDGNKSLTGVKVAQAQQDAAEANLTKLKENVKASAEEIKLAQETVTAASAATQAKVVSHIAGTFSSLGESFASLGPEGELVGAMSQGLGLMMTTLNDNLSVVADTGASVGDRVQAGLAIAQSALSTFASISKAASNARIAGIDKEIAAEKKRDGSSQASLAKISAMEAKKDKLKRKAFEQDKKMKMASVIMNTASAIMGVWNVQEPYLGPALASAYTGLIVGLGAAQLAAISGTSYDGGGSMPSAGPSKVSVGNRQNTVDLAKAGSPSGELAYARGDRGTGNMTNFTPAFTGYRAAGGNTAFMVGEQGPEMFVPDRPGSILPADETQAGAGSTPVNVSFNINTVDNTGVEDLLTNQRGYIIGMIREAANAHGETFLEQVDERAYEMEK